MDVATAGKQNGIRNSQERDGEYSIIVWLADHEELATVKPHDQRVYHINSSYIYSEWLIEL